jgi:catechol 2,3-dioxygenase-like lactoylglutathione lyase family enzyme
VTSKFDAINITCSDPEALSEFWRDVFGLVEDPAFPNEPGDTDILYMTPEPVTLAFIFQPVEEGASFVPRIHFDIDAADLTRDEEVERLHQMGAEVVADRRQQDGRGWVTLRDADGYEMCVHRNEGERNGANQS